MADKNQIHAFAAKWIDKFQDENIDYIELADHYMADDCAALGFEMDCGHAFGEAYGKAASDVEELKKVIDSIVDIPLLGSVIYSRWRYFNHWAYTGAEILEPKNRAWFVLALSRLAELSKPETTQECVIIQFPEFVALKEEIEKLHTELSMLLLERDELRYVESKNIEMQYMLTLGSLEYKAFELNCAMLRLKRKIELIQAKKNRQEKVSVSAIDKLIDEEFAEYQEKLNEQINKMNDALERGKGEFLSSEETKEMKTLYRTVVKALHPDIHPDVTEAQIRLFQNAVDAYENGDLNTLRIIKEMAAKTALPEPSENGLAVLMKEKERLLKMLDLIKEQIIEIKDSYPYNLKPIVQSEELTVEKKADLENTISGLKEMIEIYSARIKEMLR